MPEGRIDINVPGDTQDTGHRRRWPTKPPGRKTTVPRVLELRFFDLGTKPKDDNPEEWEHDPLWKNSTLSYSGTAVVEDTIYYRQNSWMTASDIETEFDVNEGDSRWERKPLTYLLAADKSGNNDVWPVGVNCPNLEIKMKDSDGNDLDRFDLQQAADSNSRGAFLESDDEDFVVRYLGWQNALNHIKVTERTSAAVWYFCTQVLDGPPLPDFPDTWISPSYEPMQLNASVQINGLFWPEFDTSDTDNYKITEEPTYDSEELDSADVPIMLDSAITQVEIYLMPRVWWGYLHVADGGSRYQYGLWTRPPHDWTMPPAVEEGHWERSCPWATSQLTGVEDVPITDTAARLILNLEGDTEDNERNALYTCVFPNNEWLCDYTAWLVENPPQCPPTTYSPAGYSNFVLRYRTIWNPTFLQFVSVEGAVPTEYWGNWYFTATEGSPTSDVSSKRNCDKGWMGSAPDGKLPIMHASHTISYSQESHGLPEMLFGWRYEVASRTVRYWDETWYLDDEDKADGVASMDDLIDSLQNHPAVVADDNEEAPVASWVFGVADFQAEDLVAIIRNAGRELYVWRKTDESRALEIDPGPYRPDIISGRSSTGYWNGPHQLPGWDCGVYSPSMYCSQFVVSDPLNGIADCMYAGYRKDLYNVYGSVELDVLVHSFAEMDMRDTNFQITGWGSSGIVDRRTWWEDYDDDGEDEELFNWLVDEYTPARVSLSRTVRPIIYYDNPALRRVPDDL